MNFTTIFTLIIAFIILRALWLRIKASGTRNDNFKSLPEKDQLSVLKECLLNNPTEKNLQNLQNFGRDQELNFDAETYRPYMNKQLELVKKKDAIAEDNELFNQEALWMDAILPLEFPAAQNAKKEGDLNAYIKNYIEGIAKLYSDEAIIKHLVILQQDYPKAGKLLDEYRELIFTRDESLADEKSLEALRKKRDSWEADLLDIEQQQDSP